MMKFIGFEREDEAEEWARERFDIQNPPHMFRAISAVDENDEFACVVVMTNFGPRNVDLNIAISDKNVMRPKETVKMFNQVFDYAFNTLRATRTTGLTRGKNYEARKIIEHFGFKPEGVLREALPNDDLHVYGFLADEYYSHKWFRGKLND